LPHGRISLWCNLVDYIKELLGLTKEEPIGGKAYDCSHTTAELVGQRTNYGAVRKTGTNELARDRKDQAWLDECTQGAGEKIRERQPIVRDGCNRGLDSIARKIDPFQEVGNFVSADAEDDLKELQTGGFLAQRRVQAGAALLDVPPSSAYCVQRSASMSSAAASIRRIATSPLVKLLL
jgi:hypothetical protein